MNTHPLLRRSLIGSFGECAYTGSKLNSSYLANLVFNHSENLNLLNQIVHPFVESSFRALAGQSKR